MSKIIRIWLINSFAVLCAVSAVATNVYANTTPPPALYSNNSLPALNDLIWNYFISLGGGVAVTSEIGDSKSFAAAPPGSDEYYIYTAYKPTQSSFLGDAFLGVEGRLNPYWLMQVGFDFNQISPYTAKGSLVQGVDQASQDIYSYRYSVMARQFLLASKVLFTLENIVHPYVFAGVGGSMNRAYNYSTSALPFSVLTRLYSNRNTSSFSYSLGAGIDLDVTNRLRVGIGYRFASYGAVNLGQANIGAVQVPGVLSQDHLYTNQLFAQITWLPI
jgi:opacity protein-like surface antigen